MIRECIDCKFPMKMQECFDIGDNNKKKIYCSKGSRINCMFNIAICLNVSVLLLNEWKNVLLGAKSEFFREEKDARII